MEKTAHLDGCLSVIAQAFMDSFSLSDAQLGKVKPAETSRQRTKQASGEQHKTSQCVSFQYAPTNKLLYAKDIPKFKQEVKSYYKQIRDQPPITPSEFKTFLLEESKVTSSIEYTT